MVIANRLTEGTTLLRRRPAAPRDARQPGRGRPRERPARAVAGRAVAAQGAAPLPGLPRPADRPRQPDPVRRAGRRALLEHPTDGPGARSSCSSTSTTSRSSTTPSATPPATGCSSRSPSASGRASAPTTWRPASAATSSRSCSSTSRTSAHAVDRRARASSTRSRVTFPIHGPGHQGRRRASASPRASRTGRPGRRPAAQRGRRDVHGQAGRQEPVRGVRADDARRDRRPPRAVDRAVARASTRGEIDVFYQPIVALATGPDVGVEALVRWHHPTRGFVEPDEFIPLAEESGAILALGRAVLFEACREAAPWRSGDRRRDLAHRQPVRRPAGPGDASSTTSPTSCARPASPPTRLVLEMTETVMFHDTPDDHRPPGGPARPRRPDRRRRLRHRLLVARLPAPVPGRHPEDRARVHRARRRPAPTAGRSPTRSSPSAGRSACGSSPRGSRSPTSSSGCASWAASSARATCSRRPMPRRGDGRAPAAAGRRAAVPGRATGAAAAAAAAAAALSSQPA